MPFPTAAFAVFFLAAFTLNWLLRPARATVAGDEEAVSLYFCAWVDVRSRAADRRLGGGERGAGHGRGAGAGLRRAHAGYPPLGRGGRGDRRRRAGGVRLPRLLPRLGHRCAGLARAVGHGPHGRPAGAGGPVDRHAPGHRLRRRRRSRRGRARRLGRPAAVPELLPAPGGRPARARRRAGAAVPRRPDPGGCRPPTRSCSSAWACSRRSSSPATSAPSWSTRRSPTPARPAAGPSPPPCTRSRCRSTPASRA